MFVYTYSFFQLIVYLLIDFFQDFLRLLDWLFIGFRSGDDGFMIGHTYLIELFQIGRINGYEIDALIERKAVVVGFEEHAIIER